jgi:signal peptidase
MAMRVVFQRNWMRATYRIRSTLQVRVGFRTFTTVDVSPAGLSVDGDLDLPPGSVVVLEVLLSDGSQLPARGTVESRRLRRGAPVIGMSLQFGPRQQARWIGQLARSAETATHESTSRVAVIATGPRLPRRFMRRAIAVTITLVSLAAASVLTLALLGYRPLVVRSGSMEPALHVGDVVLVEDVEARQLAVGDVTTLADPAEVSDSLTHRVTAIDAIGERVWLTTRGDANDTSETFQLSSAKVVGRVVARVPAVGIIVTWTASRWVRVGAALFGLLTVIAVVAGGRLRSNHPYAAGDDGLADACIGGGSGGPLRV